MTTNNADRTEATFHPRFPTHEEMVDRVRGTYEILSTAHFRRPTVTKAHAEMIVARIEALIEELAP